MPRTGHTVSGHVADRAIHQSPWRQDVLAGRLLGVQEFPATTAGYASLLGWLAGFGIVALVGVEGTGKFDPLDAVSAACAAQSGRASGAPKGRDGAVEAIRALMVAKRSARNERTQAINQARSLIVTGPDDLRARFLDGQLEYLDELTVLLLIAAGDHGSTSRRSSAHPATDPGRPAGAERHGSCTSA